MMRPRVFKIAGHWVWTCQHPNRAGESVISGSYGPGWRDPWTACLTEALRHVADQHHDVGVEEV